MAAPERSLFRESAIQKYQQRQEQSILLRVASPPIVLIFWVVFLFLAGAGGLAWSIRVPISVQGQGVMLAQEEKGQTESGLVAMLFLSIASRGDLRIGQPAIVTIGSTASLHGTVAQIGTAIISPQEARSRFDLQGGLAQVITQPSLLVTIALGTASSAPIYAGSLCDAQIQVTTQSVLSLLPGFRLLLRK